MIFNLDLNYDIPKSERGPEDKPVDNIAISISWIDFAVMAKYEKGLAGQLRRTWGKIQRKFEMAQESKIGTIDVDEKEVEFLKKTFSDEVKFPAKVAKYIEILELAIIAL